MNSFIDIYQVEKKIDDFTLGPIDLTIEPGTITALVGDNGSGKSTLLKMVMNLVKADEGTIKAFGQYVNGEHEEWKQSIAYQPQTPIGVDSFTGEELNKLISHWYPTWDQTLFIDITNELHIPLRKKFSTLSQGVQQKLTLALTIARGAKLLVLDEPTSFMDIPSKKIWIDLLVDWIDHDDRAIILASHQAEDIKKLADYLFLLKNGNTIGHFEKEALISRFRRYWVEHADMLPTQIPGEVSRESFSFISKDRQRTEIFLEANQIEPTNSVALELDEIITLLLQT